MKKNNNPTESILIKKRRPVLSIIISSNNNSSALERCLASFDLLKKDLRNIEFIVINNFSDDAEKMEEIQFLINRYNMANMTFYQSRIKLNNAQLKNLGIDFSKGSWLYFVNDTEIVTSKFSYFLGEFKFNLQMGFYRVPILNEKNKKQKMGFIKTKYYSDQASSIIINEEFIESLRLRWDSTLTTDEFLPFLDKIYSAKNVNYIYLKKHYSVIHNFYDDRKKDEMISIDELKKTFNALIKQKKINYKQFVIILIFNFLKRTEGFNDNKIVDPQIKEMLKQAKIHFYNYLPLGPKFYFKTFKMRWKYIFIKSLVSL